MNEEEDIRGGATDEQINQAYKEAKINEQRDPRTDEKFLEERAKQKQAEEDDIVQDDLPETDKLESRGYKGNRESARQRQIRLRQRALADRDKEGSTVTRGPGQVFTGGKDTVEVPDRDMRTGQLIPNETELDQFGNPLASNLRFGAGLLVEIFGNVGLDALQAASTLTGPAGLAATTSLQSGGSAFFNYLNQKIRGEKEINQGEMAAASAASLIPGLAPFKAATRAGRFYKGILRGGTTGVIDVTGTKLGRGEEVTPTDIVAGFGMGGTIGSIYGIKDGGEAFKALKNKVNTGKALILDEIAPQVNRDGTISRRVPQVEELKPATAFAIKGKDEGLTPEEIKKATDVSQDEFNKSLEPKSKIEGGEDLANIKKDVDATNEFNQKQYDLAKQSVFEFDEGQPFKVSKADIRKMKVNARRKLKLKDVKKVQAKLNDPNITDEVVQRYYDDAIRSELGYTGTAGTIDFLNLMSDAPSRKAFTSVDEFIANSRVGQSSIEDILDDMSFKLETPISKEKLQNLLDGTETYSFQTSRMRKKGEPPILINDINSLQKAYFARLLALDDIAEFEKGHINAVDQILERFYRGEKITPTASFKDNTNPEIARSIYKLVGNEAAFDAMSDINKDYIVKGLTDRELKFAQVFAGNRSRKANQDLDRIVNSVFGTEPDLESSLLAYVYPERSLNAMVAPDMKVTFAQVFMKEFDEQVQAILDLGGKMENIGSQRIEVMRQRALKTTLQSFPPDLSKDMGKMLMTYLKANKIDVVDEFGNLKF